MAGSSGTLFAYDGEGRRIAKSPSRGTTDVYVYDADGDLASEYSNAPASVAAGTQFLTGDQLGTTRVVTLQAGTVSERHDYEPFGAELIVNSVSPRYGVTGYGAAIEVPVQFTGKERDWETGLDFFGARYFSGAQGRFTSADWSESPQPIPYADTNDPQTLNLYSYVRNNPLSHGDLDGHKVDCTGDNARGIGCQFLADWNAAHGVGEKAEAAVTAVGHGMEKASDFVNTAPGLGLVAGMAIFAETGGGDETPAVAEAGEEVGATLSNGANLIAQLGSKLNFLFGQSGGANFARSEGMRAALQQVGLNDTIENRVLVSENLTNALNNTGSIVSRTGDRVVRESLLMGPTGGVKLQSIWENTKLITVKVFGGR